MKQYYKYSTIAIFMVLSTLFTSCFNGDPRDRNCDNQHFIDVVVNSSHTNKLTDVILYVYNSDGEMIGSKFASEDGLTDITEFQQYGKIDILAIGNGSSTKQNITSAKDRKPKSEFEISLITKSLTPKGLTVVSPPADLFLGLTNYEYNIVKQSENKAKTNYQSIVPINIDRKISSLTILAKGVSNITNAPLKDLKFIIHKIHSKMDSKGTPYGDYVGLEPFTNYDTEKDEIYTPVFYSFPTVPQAIVVDIYNGSELLYTASADTNGQPITLSPDKLTTIIIEFGGNIDVKAIISDFEEVNISQEV